MNSIVNERIISVPTGGAASPGVDEYGGKGISQGTDEGCGVTGTPPEVTSSSVFTGNFGPAGA